MSPPVGSITVGTAMYQRQGIPCHETTRHLDRPPAPPRGPGGGRRPAGRGAAAALPRRPRRPGVRGAAVAARPDGAQRLPPRVARGDGPRTRLSAGHRVVPAVLGPPAAARPADQAWDRPPGRWV